MRRTATVLVTVVLASATASVVSQAAPPGAGDPKPREGRADDSGSETPTPEGGLDEAKQFAALLAAADRRISSRTRGETETPHFRVVTDVFAKGSLEQLAGSLEGAFFTINEVLALPTRPDERKVAVYFFERESQHYGFASGTRGVYVPPGLLAFYKGDSNTQELLDVLVHESTHAFLERYIVEPGVDPPRWLSEGFATYMGESLVHQGRILPGRYFTRQRLDFLNRSVVVRPRPLEMAKRIVIRLKYGPMISLEELVSADRRTFYGDDVRDYYDLAWAFVHYLRHARPEGAKGFSALVKGIASGKEAKGVFETVYSAQPAEMEQAVHEYVKNVLAKPEDPPREYLEAPRARPTGP